MSITKNSKFQINPIHIKLNYFFFANPKLMFDEIISITHVWIKCQFWICDLITTSFDSRNVYLFIRNLITNSDKLIKSPI